MTPTKKSSPMYYLIFLGLPYFLPVGKLAPGLPTYNPKNAAPAPTIVDINIA